MNREIKFRAYLKGSNEVIDITGFDFRQGKFVTLFLNDGFRVEALENVMLLQYTGLKDKDSKGIYEGDIKLWEFNNIKQVSVCYWSDTDCGFRWKLMKHNEKKSQVELGVLFDNEEDFYKYVLECNQRQNGFDSYSKIIGNIYQNLELLK